MLIKPFSYLQQAVEAGGLPNIDTTNLVLWVDANFPGASPTTQWDDNSGNGNHMTVTSAGVGGTAPTLTSTTDEAYYQLSGSYISPGVNANQDGGGYFTLAGSPFTTTTPDLTITVWLYPDLDYSQSWTVGRWVSAGTGSPSTRLFFGSGFGSTNFGYGTTTYNPSPMVDPTQSAWQEFTVTFDLNFGTNGIRWYNNGTQYAQASAGGGSLTIGTKPLHIGKQFDTLNEYFSGRIAMVFIYERVLSGAEVLSNYNAVASRYNY